MGKKLNIISNQIEGVKVTNLSELKDNRGSVLHMLRSDSVDFDGFGECYFSEVLPGAIKAWKYHYNQIQNIAVPSGLLRLVLYDERELSSTFGNILEFDLGRPSSYKRVKIPPNIWYGFACIGESPAILVNCVNIPHDPSDTIKLEISDNLIPYTWHL
jgi:dTDP-4-dehydrorhamnose 3,5-epimerase